MNYEKKKLAAAAAFSVALGALGQGIFVLTDEGPGPGLALDAPGNWYSGTLGMEVWELNSTIIPAGVNLSPAQGSGVLGYDGMKAAGFTKEATFAGTTTVSPGTFELGRLLMPDVQPQGATVVVALAAWNTSATSWSAMLAEATPGTRAGVIAVVQPTIPDFLNPGAPPDLAMDQDLVMTAIPEPSGLALAGVGGALMLFMRRRALRGDGRQGAL